MVERRTVLKVAAASAVVPWLAACAESVTSSSSTASSSSSGAAASLVFDTTASTEKTKTVTTSKGDVKVTYRFWDATTYVAKPVDATYQSLTVSEPISIDGKRVDASSAPILLALNIGGYMSSSVSSASSGGMGGGAPAGNPPGGSNGVQSGSGAMTSSSGSASNADLALAAGYVVISPGARGRDLKSSAGIYFGKAPAAIVDLKAAVRYIRSNKGRIPGDVSRIVSSGSSAGGALSALLGASGDSSLYDSYLAEIGAADASDAIFASGDWCPITDLEHADAAYEWAFGSLSSSQSGTVDSSVSKALAATYPAYVDQLGLSGLGGFGTVTSAKLEKYLLTTFLEPSATTYLSGLSSSARTSYLSSNPWITWSGGKATFTLKDFAAHVGRKKSAPAFDAFDLSAAENNEFGDETTDSRHFTLYSLRHATGKSTAELDSDLPEKIDLMNPMYFLEKGNKGRSRHWWIRVGSSDSDTSPTVVATLATMAHTLGDSVDVAYYWDAGHGANDDPEAFIAWIGSLT